MQNLSWNNLEQITEMNNLSLNKLKQIKKIRSIKNCNNMSREGLLIAILKSKQSHTELRRSEYNNTGIGVIEKLFNKLRNNFSKEEIDDIRIKFYQMKKIDKYLKEVDQYDSLTA